MRPYSYEAVVEVHPEEGGGDSVVTGHGFLDSVCDRRFEVRACLLVVVGAQGISMVYGADYLGEQNGEKEQGNNVAHNCLILDVPPHLISVYNMKVRHMY